MTNENALRQHEPQVKQPEVTKQVDRLQVATKSLEETVAMLEERLRPILAERKVANGAASGAPEPVRVPLAEELHTVGDGIEQVRERIFSIAARLEI